jgi:hypothetical protein
MKQFWRIILVLMGCVHLCGGPQGLAQCVAWAGMLVNYSQQATVAEAVEMTFDGKHPCRLCLAIQEAEKKSDPAKPAPLPSSSELMKLCKDMLPPELIRTSPGIVAGERETAPGSMDAVGFRRSDAPSLPPPRVLA